MKYALLFISVLLAFPASADPLCEWPHWELFKAAYIENGRVIDRSDPRHITTSEGQSYAMFLLWWRMTEVVLIKCWPGRSGSWREAI